MASRIAKITDHTLGNCPGGDRSGRYVTLQPTAFHQAASIGTRSARHDPRWPAIMIMLCELRGQGRRSIRMVDVDCDDGALLLLAAQKARKLGFAAVEVRGVDGSPALVACARARAAQVRDRAIGISYEVADMTTTLHEECEFPADLILCPRSAGANHCSGIEALAAAAGDMVIGDRNVVHRREVAA